MWLKLKLALLVFGLISLIEITEAKIDHTNDPEFLNFLDDFDIFLKNKTDLIEAYVFYFL